MTSYPEFLQKCRDDPHFAAKAAGGIDQARGFASQMNSSYTSFVPRPDNPEMFDQQTSFIDSMTPGVCLLIGGNASGTTTAALYKVAQFLLCRQAPPRKDCPFWIISDSYESCMNVAWKEKLHGQGFIPRSEVDWERITWYDSKLALPYTVPLRPWPGHDPDKNWMIEFKSYEQGRQKLQARAVGGFCFIEQFPYPLLLEVLRGCREYNFPGSKICEFTPVDPSLSYEIEEMITEDKLPRGWEHYRCNTALNAPNLADGWFDEFFGAVSEDLRETRLTGAFATYEGLIYPYFDARVHVVPEMEHPPGIRYARGIDWGASKDHPFAAVLAYVDGMGCWWVYDEYLEASARVTDEDHTDNIKAIEGQYGGPWTANSWADPSRPDRINNFSLHGMQCHGGRNAQDQGIECVRALLNIQRGSGQPRLRIHSRCKQLIRQIRSLRWRAASGTGLNPAKPKHEQLKRDDDLADALRYLLFSENQFPQLGISSMRRVTRERGSRGLHLDTNGGGGQPMDWRTR